MCYKHEDYFPAHEKALKRERSKAQVSDKILKTLEVTPSG
jgi:hypothetical protein